MMRIPPVPQNGSTKHYSDLRNLLNDQAEKLDDGLLDSRQDTADVRVTASNIHFAPNLADVTTETIEFSRTGANLSYASSVRNFGGKELSRRTISFMNANDGTINVFDSDGESAIDFILTK